MKKLIVMTKFILLSLVIAVSLSCDGEDGAQGPAGPAGQDGINGLDGQDGQDGNANVIASAWTDFESANWEALATEFGVSVRNYPVTASELTEEIRDSGVVLVYVKFIGFGDAAINLPFTTNITGGGLEKLYYISETSLITIKFMNQDGSGDPGTFSGVGNSYRYVLIPSNNTANRGVKELDFTKMSYEQVMDHFGIDY